MARPKKRTAEAVVKDIKRQTRRKFNAEEKIRKDFGLKWSAITEAGNIVVSDTIKLHTELQFAKQ